jgi:hypothetical protein
MATTLTRSGVWPSHGKWLLRPHAEYVPKFLWAIASVHFKRVN